MVSVGTTILVPVGAGCDRKRCGPDQLKTRPRWDRTGWQRPRTCRASTRAGFQLVGSPTLRSQPAPTGTRIATNPGTNPLGDHAMCSRTPRRSVSGCPAYGRLLPAGRSPGRWRKVTIVSVSWLAASRKCRWDRWRSCAGLRPPVGVWPMAVSVPVGRVDGEDGDAVVAAIRAVDEAAGWSDMHVGAVAACRRSRRAGSRSSGVRSSAPSLGVPARRR